MTDTELDELFKEMMKAEPTGNNHRRPCLIIHNGRKGYPWEAECVRITLDIREMRIGGPKSGHWEQTFDIRVYLNDEYQAEELGLGDYLKKYGQNGLSYERHYIDGQYKNDDNKNKDVVLDILDTLLDTRGYIIDTY